VPSAIGDFQGRKVVMLAGRFLFSDRLSHGFHGVGPGCGQIVEFDPDPVGNDRSADQSNVEEIAGHARCVMRFGRLTVWRWKRSEGIISSTGLVLSAISVAAPENSIVAATQINQHVFPRMVINGVKPFFGKLSS
jgi:hypothetical protein